MLQDEQGCCDELNAWTLGLRDPEFLHQHVVDCWAAQHATAESKPISIAFALLGLYLFLEKGWTGREVQKAHMRLAQPKGRGAGRNEWPRFEIPAECAAMTACAVMRRAEGERREAIRRWCAAVWQMWSESQEEVRRWVDSELAAM